MDHAHSRVETGVKPLCSRICGTVSAMRFKSIYTLHLTDSEQTLQSLTWNAPFTECPREVAIRLVQSTGMTTAIKLPLCNNDTSVLWLYIILNATFGKCHPFIRAHEPEEKLHNKCFSTCIAQPERTVDWLPGGIVEWKYHIVNTRHSWSYTAQAESRKLRHLLLLF